MPSKPVQSQVAPSIHWHCFRARLRRWLLALTMSAGLVQSSLFGATAPPNFVWANQAGGSGNDIGFGVAADGVGNIYVAGVFNGTASFGTTNVVGAGSDDIFIAKYDSVGALQWVRSAGGTAGDQGWSMGVDGAGNAYVSGMFQGTATFGNTNVTSAGGSDIFIAKYDPTGVFQWVRKAGGTGSDLSTKAAVDLAGNVFLTGSFTGTASFGSTNLVAAGGRDIFVAKYDRDGVFQWVQQAGGSGDDEGTAINTDTNGNCYVGGKFHNTANFSGSSLVSAGGFDAFISKYNSAGVLQWVQKAGGTLDDLCQDIAVDGSGNIFVTGSFEGTANFGSTNLVSAFMFDGYTAKYSSTGTLQWVRQVTGSAWNDQNSGIAVDDAGFVFVHGYFNGTASFGGTNLTSVSASPSADGCVVKYDTAGTLQWVLQVPGTLGQYAQDIVVDKAGQVFVIGYNEGVATFGGTTLTTAGVGDMYLTRIGTLAPPVITAQPASQFVDLGGPAALTISVAGNPPMSYQWQRNGTNIVGGTNATYSVAAIAPGEVGVPFRCLVSNFDGRTNSTTAQFIINPNTRPTPVIITPSNGSFYAAGDTISFAGTAADPEDGSLTAGAFSWMVEFHHDIHTHPFLGPLAGVTSGSFTIPAVGEASTNVFYRILLTVTDSGGRQGTNYVDVLPRTSVLTLTTSPPGLKIKLDGLALNTPTNVASVVGFIHSLGVVSPQPLNGTNYNFVYWSDAGSTNHDIVTSATDQNYIAGFTRNNAPVLQPISAKVVNEGSLLSFPISASDIDVQPANTLAFSLVAPPSGASIHPVTGMFSWTPSEAQGGSIYTLTVRVIDDGSPNLSDTKNFSVTVNKVNSPPVLTVPETLTINELTQLSVTLTALDPDLPANPLTFSVVAAPSGVNLNPTTGVLTWTPSELQGPSTNTLTVRVSDSGSPSLSVTNSFKVIVNEVNVAPVLAVIADKTVAENSLLSFRIVATDADLPANKLTYSFEPGAPTGASINPTTGQFTWTPVEEQGPGVYPITVRVTDNGVPSLSATRTFIVTVNEVNTAPVLAPIVDVTVPQGSWVRFTNSVTDLDLPANLLFFSLEPGAPAGASLDPTTGVFDWPLADDVLASTNFIRVIVSDNGVPSLSATQSFTVVVTLVPTNVVDLVAGVGVSGSERPCHNYYRFHVDPEQTRVLFESANFSGFGKLVLRRGDLPTATLHDHEFTGLQKIGGAASIQQLILTRGESDISGDWYATVISTERVDLTFSIGASVPSVEPEGALFLSPNGIRLAVDPIQVGESNATFIWSAVPGEKYEVDVSTDLVNWTLLTSVVADGAVLTVTDPTPPTGSAPRFYRIRQIRQPILTAS